MSFRFCSASIRLWELWNEISEGLFLGCINSLHLCYALHLNETKQNIYIAPVTTKEQDLESYFINFSYYSAKL